MAKNVVALCTKDVRYMKAFTSYVERNESDRIFVKPFNDVSVLKEHIKNNRVDAVLIGSEYRECFKDGDGGRLYILSDERYVHEEDDNFIFRYQSADEVVKQLCSSCSDGGFISCAGKRNAEFTAVMSPCYPIEREIFSRELADYYGDKSKLLYVNFASFTACDIGVSSGLSEILYYMSEEGERLKEKVWGMISDRENYKEIAGVKNYRDLYGMTEKEVIKLLECIADIDEYDRVIFDVGHVGEAVYPLFDKCMQIIIPVMDKDSQGTAHFMGDFLTDGCEKYADRVSVVQLPEWWNVGSEMRHKWISNSGY